MAAADDWVVLLSLHVVCLHSWGGIFWKGGVGYVTRDMLAAHMPAATLGNDALIMVCGPPGKCCCCDHVLGAVAEQRCCKLRSCVLPCLPRFVGVMLLLITNHPPDTTRQAGQRTAQNNVT